jgi:hypothetical protein
LRPLFFLSFFLVSACSTVGHERVEGWPELTIVEHRVAASEMYERCRKYVGFGALPMACAEFNLATKRCDIWLIEGFAPRSIVEHERLHCQGHDHPGETGMRDFLARWQAYQAAVGAPARPVIAAEAAE